MTDPETFTGVTNNWSYRKEKDGSIVALAPNGARHVSPRWDYFHAAAHGRKPPSRHPYVRAIVGIVVVLIIAGIVGQHQSSNNTTTPTQSTNNTTATTAPPTTRADATPLVGQWAIIHAAIGCRAVEDLHRVGDMLRAGDKDAAHALVAERCGHIPDETEAMIDDWSLWYDADCVRPRGNTVCLWVRKSAISAKP
jgi:hypothetical protein